MYISVELKTFVIFILVGIILGIIFDIFRALRKIKKTSNIETIIQDVIYFVIVGTVVSITLYNTTNDGLRIHIFFAIILRCFNVYINNK